MKKIFLTGKNGSIIGNYALVDNKNYDWLNKFRWNCVNENGIFYACAVVNGSQIKMHRLIMAVSDSMILIDHKDHNGLNNQERNIRKATHSQNLMNIGFGRGSSKYKGVSWMKTKRNWRLQIVVDGKNKFIGYYKSEIDAAKEYNRLAKIHYGKFACLNTISK